MHWPALQLPLQQSPGAVQASPPGKQEPQRNIPPVVIPHSSEQHSVGEVQISPSDNPQEVVVVVVVVVVVDSPPPAEEVEVEESAWLPTHWSVTSEQGYWQVYSQLAITQVAPQG